MTSAAFSCTPSSRSPVSSFISAVRGSASGLVLPSASEYSRTGSMDTMPAIKLTPAYSAGTPRAVASVILSPRKSADASTSSRSGDSSRFSAFARKNRSGLNFALFIISALPMSRFHFYLADIQKPRLKARPPCLSFRLISSSKCNGLGLCHTCIVRLQN